MTKSKERWREDTKNKSRGEGGEGDEGAARKETVEDRQGKKENAGRSGATDWNISGPAQPPGLEHQGAR